MNDEKYKLMKKIIIVIGILVGILGMLIAYSAKSQQQLILKSIKSDAGFITPKLKKYIFLRIVSEAAHEQWQGRKAI